MSKQTETRVRHPECSETSLGKSAVGQDKLYPWWLTHLQSATKRLKYATLPFFLLVSLDIIERGSSVFGNMAHHIDNIIIAFIGLTVVTYTFLTTVHLAIREYKPWRQRSKIFRMYCFFACCWAVGVVAFVALFDPYNNGGWDYKDTKEYFHMFSIALVPPVLIGVAMYSYQKYVR